MKPWRLFGLLGIVLLAGFLSAQDGAQKNMVRKGKLVKLDLDGNSITIKTADGENQQFLLDEKTQVFDAKGENLKEKLQGFKAGADIFYKGIQKDGKDYLFGIKLADGAAAKQPQPPPKVDLTKLIPLGELGKKEYQGFKGGFYPDGENQRPKAHEAAGLKFAKEVQPRNAEGKIDPQGKIVLLSIGMSNTSQASGRFQKALAAGGSGKNPQLVFINGAVGGQTAERIQNPDDNADGTKYWAIVDQRLKEAKLTRAQVQIIWVKQADGGPTEGFPKYAKKLEDELARIVQIFPKRFPNAKLVYLSGRTFGGYAKTMLNPEPYAYESGFSVKWLIERQIKGESALNFDPAKGAVKAPWLSWGPDLWANGSTKRMSDGFSYDASDFEPKDGTHHSPAGSEKIGRLMLQFFKTDTTTKTWFVQ